MAELDGRRGGTRKWSRIRARILARDGGICRSCGAAATCVDHIRPRAAGGDDTWQNLQALCTACHKRKTVGELRTLAQMPRRRRRNLTAAEKAANKAERDRKAAELAAFGGLEGAGRSPFGGLA